MKKYLKWVGLVVLVAGALTWQWWQKRQSALPTGIASGNGRIEAAEIDVAAKYAGKVMEVLVEEGDMVAPGQPLVSLDGADLQAQLDRSEAQLAERIAAVAEVKAQLAAARSDLVYAEDQYARTAKLLKSGIVSQSQADQQRNARNAATAAVAAAEARLETTEKGIDAYRASVRQIETQIQDSILAAPAMGRVLYRLTQPGEMLPAGGKAITILDLSNVYMEIFLSAADAGVLQIGAEARIMLDVAPDLPIPARVTFVSPQAQFTPKQIETRDEREKLMFRVKLQIPPELVLKNMERVKTGVRGVGYVRTNESAAWPAFLEGHLTGTDK